MRFRFTMKELKERSDNNMIRILITERKSNCTNPYSPLYKRLSELEQKYERLDEQDEMKKSAKIEKQLQERKESNGQRPKD